MADAGGLQTVEHGDIYTLFRNMLDNAIEHVKR
jgi:hypothetical protein